MVSCVFYTAKLLSKLSVFFKNSRFLSSRWKDDARSFFVIKSFVCAFLHLYLTFCAFSFSYSRTNIQLLRYSCFILGSLAHHSGIFCKNLTIIWQNIEYAQLCGHILLTSRRLIFNHSSKNPHPPSFPQSGGLNEALTLL